MKNFKKLIFTKNEEKFIKDNEDIIYAGYWSSNSIKLKKNKDYLKCVWYLKNASLDLSGI